jgi:hypothetical protein
MGSCSPKQSLNARRLTGTHNHENTPIPLLDTEGLGVVDRNATTPYPLLLRRRGVVLKAENRIINE